MITIDPAWGGKVVFYELVYGTWLTYIFCVLWWSKVLRQPLAEWRYVMLTLIGAAAFWVNHYFQQAPLYWWMLNTYSLVAWFVWFQVGVRQGTEKSMAWKIGATLSFVLFTIAFICFEYISRIGVDVYGVSEFWFMLTALFGFIGIVLWRGKYQENKS